MLPDEPKSIKVVILYNQKDYAVFDWLSDHLSWLRRKGLVELWSEASAGADRKEEANTHINEAKVIIILESSSFQSIDKDNYYSSSEMISLIDARAKKGVKVWPVRIKPIFGSIFENHDFFFGKEKALTQWTPQDDGYRSLTEKIYQEIAQMIAEEWVQSSNTCYERNLLLDALIGYNKSLEYTSDYQPALLGKLKVFLKQDKQEEAEKCFQQIISYTHSSTTNKGPDFIGALIKGYALLEMGKPFEAQKAFQEVYRQLASSTNDFQRDVCADAYCGEGDVYLTLATSPANYSTNYYEHALTAYSKAKTLCSDFLKYLLRIGETYIALGKFKQSDNHYESALATYEKIPFNHPNYVSALSGKGEALYCLRRFDEALEIYKRAKSIDAKDLRICNGLGQTLLKLKNYEGALSCFNFALHFDNKNKYYLYGKGQALAELGFLIEALQTFQEARSNGYILYDLFVNQAKVLLKLADTEYIIGHHSKAKTFYNEARESFEIAARQNWEDYYSYCNGLGRAYFGSKDWTSALFWYQKAMTFRPSNADPCLDMGKTSIELGCYKNAENYLISAKSLLHSTESSIDEADVMNAYGYLYYKAAEEPSSENYYKYQQAAYRCFKQAIRIRADNPVYFIGLGKASTALNRYDEAINSFDKALDSNPRIAECLFLKGRCYYELREYFKAYKQYQLIRDSDVDSIFVSYDLGETLLAMNNLYDALDAFDEEISQLGKNTVRAYCGRGIAYYKQGEIKEALAAFNKADELDPLICASPEYATVLENMKHFINKNLRLNPGDEANYRDKADVLRLLLSEQSEEVKAAYTSAINHGYLSPNTYYYSGRVYYALQEYENALSDFEEAVRRDPNHQGAQKGIKEAESMIGLKQRDTGKNKFNFWKWKPA